MFCRKRYALLVLVHEGAKGPTALGILPPLGGGGRRKSPISSGKKTQPSPSGKRNSWGERNRVGGKRLVNAFRIPGGEKKEKRERKRYYISRRETLGINSPRTPTSAEAELAPTKKGGGKDTLESPTISAQDYIEKKHPPCP